MTAARQKKALLDTNVWLDFYIADRPGHAVALKLVNRLIELSIDILFAIQSTKNVYYLIGSSYKQEMRKSGKAMSEQQAGVIDEVAWACLGNMNEIGVAVGADASDIWLARKYRPLHHDFEDDLVLAAASRADADLLVTSDAALIQHAPVPALNPADALALLSA